jgi:hypothetical protein
MRRPAKLVIRGIVAGIALASLGFMVASPASAHTNNIYGFVNYDGPSGFATFDRTNADATLLPALLSTGPDHVLGIDITNEVASGVGVTYNASDTYYTFTWDHTTGAILSVVGAYVAGATSLDNMRGLDTLPDGTLVTWVDYTLDSGKGSASYSAIATVNSTTGELTPVIDMSDLLQGDPPGYSLQEIATDPISGSTFALLLATSSSAPAFVQLNFSLNSHSVPTTFGGTGFENGDFRGADFDADGTLYFIFNNNQRDRYELSSVSGPATWATAPRTVIGDAAGNLGTNVIDPYALAVEYTPPVSPALAKTGAEFPTALLLLGSVAVLAGAVTVVTVSRKRRTA